MKKGVDISRGSTYLLVNKHSQESFYPGKKRLGSTYLLVNKYISTGECFFRGVNIYGDSGNYWPLEIFVLLRRQLHITSNIPEPAESDDSGFTELSKSIKLSGEVLSRRNTKVVLRHHKPNRVMLLEKYSHCLLIFLDPFANENDLMLHGCYAAKLSEENLLEIVNQNKQKFEPNSNLIGIYLQQHWSRRTLSCVIYSIWYVIGQN